DIIIPPGIFRPLVELPVNLGQAAVAVILHKISLRITGFIGSSLHAFHITVVSEEDRILLHIAVFVPLADAHFALATVIARHGQEVFRVVVAFIPGYFDRIFRHTVLLVVPERPHAAGLPIGIFGISASQIRLTDDAGDIPFHGRGRRSLAAFIVVTVIVASSRSRTFLGNIYGKDALAAHDA